MDSLLVWSFLSTAYGVSCALGRLSKPFQTEPQFLDKTIKQSAMETWQTGKHMLKRDLRDILGGLIMIAIGLFAAIYGQRYELGQLQRMGPGYFPVSLGWLLALLGVFITVPAFFRQGMRIQVEWKSLIWCTIGVVAFGLALDPLGLVLSTILMVILTSMPGLDMTWKTRIILALVVALITWLIFIFGLGMVIPVWPWSP